MIRAARALLLALAVLLFAGRALAHEFEPGVLALVETGPGRFAVRWTPPTEEGVRIVYPGGCALAGAELVCERGLEGPIVFEGLERATKIVVSVRFRAGPPHESVATHASPSVAVGPSPSSSAASFVRLGAEHVFGGFDHVAFVVGLFLIVGARRRLVGTVTAFTVAHSLTLALASMDVLALPRAPVEATIAASVLLVGTEALSTRPTATRRWPWAVAFAFGLVHGLGFAGALGELGLPRETRAVTLLSFNAGVEIAQLAIVLVLVAGERALGTRGGRAPRTALAYVVGTLGAYWLWDRAAAIFTSS